MSKVGDNIKTYEEIFNNLSCLTNRHVSLELKKQAITIIENLLETSDGVKELNKIHDTNFIQSYHIFNYILNWKVDNNVKDIIYKLLKGGVLPWYGNSNILSRIYYYTDDFHVKLSRYIIMNYNCKNFKRKEILDYFMMYPSLSLYYKLRDDNIFDDISTCLFKFMYLTPENEHKYKENIDILKYNCIDDFGVDEIYKSKTSHHSITVFLDKLLSNE